MDTLPEQPLVECFSAEFKAYPKTPRLNREVIITEKLDGTNSQLFLVNPNEVRGQEHLATVHGDCSDPNALSIFVGSRSRWITPGKQTDNYGFAGWVRDNAQELIKLGPGRHFGEWWGQGIQRNYGLKEKRFSLFNACRWTPNQDAAGNIIPGVWEQINETNSFGPACCHVVPVWWRGIFDQFDVRTAVEALRLKGSWAVPGYMNPEGVIVYHTAAKQAFKVLLENDEGRKGE